MSRSSPSFAGMVRVYQYAAVTIVMPLIRFLTLCSVLGVVSAVYGALVGIIKDDILCLYLYKFGGIPDITYIPMCVCFQYVAGKHLHSYFRLLTGCT
jgi:hypothetical protein